MTVNILLRDRKKKKHKWNYTKSSRAMYDVESFQIIILKADNMLDGGNFIDEVKKLHYIAQNFQFNQNTIVII